RHIPRPFFARERGPGSSFAVELRRTRHRRSTPAQRDSRTPVRRPKGMATRRPYVLVLAGLLAVPCTSIGATHTTQNFVVEAPTVDIARQIGQRAEQYRREKAIQWLGREMPPWGQRLPIKATVTMGSAGGATSFAFDNG